MATARLWPLTFAAALLALPGCEIHGPVSPTPWATLITPSATLITLIFEGAVTDSCELISLQACTPSQFGTGVAAGVTAAGTLTLDTQAPLFSRFEQTGYASATYVGAAVGLTVGGNALSRNSASLARLEVDATATYMQLVVMGGGGFQSGQVAGLPIHYFTLTLPIAPSRYPDTSLVSDGALFDQGVRDQPDKASFSIKHIPNPSLRTPGIQSIASGVMLRGRITAIRRQ